MLEPIKKSRVYEHIIEQVRTLVAEGKLKPGDQLPPERELALTLQVSRASVREALRGLEMQGLIEGRHGGGTFVKDMSPELLVQRLSGGPRPRVRELREILEVRELIEPGIARLAAERATPDVVARLEELCARQRERVAAGESYAEEDSAFHYTLALAADNQTLLRLQDTILEILRQTRADSIHGPERPTRSLQGHQAILAAVRRQDGAAAYDASLNHISAVRDIITAAASADE